MRRLLVVIEMALGSIEDHLDNPIRLVDIGDQMDDANRVDMETDTTEIMKVEVERNKALNHNCYRKLLVLLQIRS
eukprot:gene26373-32947_t